MPARFRYQSGPLIWSAILGVTSVLLFLFQHVLWLVIPGLLALIGYYLLYPLQQRLIMGGVSSDASAAWVSGGAITVGGGAMLLAFPWFSAHLVSWQQSGGRYVQGGLHLIVDTLQWLEQSYSWMAKAHLSRQLLANLAELGDRLVGTYLASALMTAAAWVPSLLLVPFLVFFFLRDGGHFKMFLGRAVPNAFFERTLYLLDRVDHTARQYFKGLIKLTLLDAFCLAGGLWLIGVSAPLVLGLLTAVLAWVPYIGSIFGCVLVVMVAATDFPGNPAIAYATVGLFVGVRLLDDFLFMPMTIGRSLKLHPLLTVLMIFVGGAVAGVAGLMLVLPVLGVAKVLGETVGEIVTDPRLRARHVYARNLMRRKATCDLGC